MIVWLWLIENKEWIGGVFLGLFSFLTGRKSKKNEDKSGELQNLEAARNVEKSLFEDMQKTIERYNTLLEQSDEIIQKLENIIKDKNKAIITLEKELKSLKN